MIKKLKNIFKSKSSQFPQSPQLTYSYDCEDLLLEKIIHKKKGFYVDIGAHHPVKHSNTYLLYTKGWRGINIDANPSAISKFNKQRKDCINLNMGISNTEGEFEFYISQNPLLSSFDKVKVLEAKDKWDFGYTSITVKTYRLETILNKYLNSNMNIDLLNIDVEGLEFEILQSNNWDRYLPTIIIIELHERYIEDVMRSNIYTFLHQKGYSLVSKTFITLIFERVS